MRPDPYRGRHRGFSLVELMVSVVIGLLALLFATRLVISGERNKDAAVGGSDSMQNGMLALFSLSGDANTAGWGLNDRTVAGCDTSFYDANGYQLPSIVRGDGATITPLASVVIQSNGANSDVISFNSGSSQSAVGSVKMMADYVGGNSITIDSRTPYGYNNNDVLVVAAGTPSPLLPCTLIQMAGFNQAPGLDDRLLIAAGGPNRFNQIAGMAQAYNKSVTYLYNLGQPNLLHLHTWSVSRGTLMLRASDLPGSEANGASVTDNIVAIKAQYGLDTRVITDYDPNPVGNGTTELKVTTNGMQITQWSATMPDADGDGVAGSPGDFQRIAAVRIAVVARSKSADKPDAAGACSATTVLPTIFNSNAPASAAAAPVQVNVTVANDTLDWKCYRYRVFETIVPVINSQFRP
jgi:type IV pilus assembly protein PilW